MYWAGAFWAGWDAKRTGARRNTSIPRVLQQWDGLFHRVLGEILAFQAAVTCLCPNRHLLATSRTGAGAFPNPFPFPATFKGRGWMCGVL